MIFYLTYNDLPSGIYSGQVIDVVKFLNKELKQDVCLVSLISLRGYSKNKQKIKSELPEAIVLPMFPGVQRWRKNSILLSLLTMIKKPSAIIGRSVLATQLALKLKKQNKIARVIYDGRGAIAAEWKEYSVVTDPVMLKDIFLLEQEVILNSDFRIAVSNQLVDHWANEYNYRSKDHVIIPCTLNKVFEEVIISEDTIQRSRSLFGFNSTDVVFVYSGSLAGWQSFELLNVFFQKTLGASSLNKVLFLSEPDNYINVLTEKFPKQVFNKKVAPNEVPKYLLAGDYGILIREQSITNKVASPVKFAEYLACGLQVIISDHLGDYSSLVSKNKFSGSLMNKSDDFSTISIDQKLIIKNFASKEFVKSHFSEQYRLVANS